MKPCQCCAGPLPPNRTKPARRCFDCSAAARVVMLETYKAYRLALKTGVIPPITGRSCVDCGADARAYDHRDYFAPLAVEPVCWRCNDLRGSAYPFLNGIQHFRVAA